MMPYLYTEWSAAGLVIMVLLGLAMLGYRNYHVGRQRIKKVAEQGRGSGTTAGNHNRKVEAAGYRPLNVGYSPEEQRGYPPKSQGTSLPNPPRGGTGENSKPPGSTTTEREKK